MFQRVVFVIASLLLFAGISSGQTGYRVLTSFPIRSGGGWDYIAVHDQKIYVSHATQVNILDQASGDSVGVINGTTGVHGIAFTPAPGKGYTSNGKLNTVSVFDLKTNEVLKQISVGQNPDAITYDAFSGMIITCNGRSHDLSLIDPATDLVVATIPVSGKPETAVTDGKGFLFVNIEDKNSISKIDLGSRKVVTTWSLQPAEGPTGLAIDTLSKRLFAGCDKKLVVVDYTSGRITDTLAIGDGCDGVVFDDTRREVFASCGDGTLAMATVGMDGRCSMTGVVNTLPTARTVTIDPSVHRLYLPAAMLGKSVAGQRAPVVPGSFRIIVVAR